jgi:hypothetical protein
MLISAREYFFFGIDELLLGYSNVHWSTVYPIATCLLFASYLIIVNKQFEKH